MSTRIHFCIFSTLLACLCFQLPGQVFGQDSTDSLFPVEVGRFFGYIDIQGELVIPARFSEAGPFHEGLARVAFNDQYGFITPRNALITEPVYGSLSKDFQEGLAPVFIQDGNYEFEGSFGYLNVEGDLVIPAQYEDAQPFSHGLAAVQVDGLWGFIDSLGNWVIPARYEALDPFSEERARFYQDGRYGFLDKQGIPAIPAVYSECADRFQEGLLAYYDGQLWGFIDIEGREVLAPAYANPSLSPPQFSQGLAEVVDPQSGKWGFVDQSGQWIIAAHYDWCYGFSEGLAAVLLGDNWGFVNTQGQLSIPFQEKVDEVGHFSQGLCPVSIDYEWKYYLDRQGKLVWTGKE